MAKQAADKVVPETRGRHGFGKGLSQPTGAGEMQRYELLGRLRSRISRSPSGERGGGRLAFSDAADAVPLHRVGVGGTYVAPNSGNDVSWRLQPTGIVDVLIGRSERIRTSGPCVPNTVL